MTLRESFANTLSRITNNIEKVSNLIEDLEKQRTAIIHSIETIPDNRKYIVLRTRLDAQINRNRARLIELNTQKDAIHTLITDDANQPQLQGLENKIPEQKPTASPQKK